MNGESQRKKKRGSLAVWLLSLLLVLSGAVHVPFLAVSAADAGKADQRLEVHFIDVGQADCILARSGSSAMLIDAGNNDDADTIIRYLENQGVSKLDYVIGTHPHEDHIGSLDTVIEHFDIGDVIMPDKAHTSQSFEDVLTAVEDKGLSITIPEPGDTYELGEAAFTVIAPVKEYGDELNDWSVGIKLTYRDNSFILCGDAEAEAEADIAAGQTDLKADVYKADHHGSETSSSDVFLDAVDPDYVVISCGTGNTYGHPHQSVLDKFQDRGIQVFRTDEQGTIVAVSDGSNIAWSTESGEDINSGGQTLTEADSGEQTLTEAAPANDEGGEIIVHITKTGEKYHSAGCQYLKKSDIEISLEDAKAQGYSPCSKCNPPQ